MSMCEAMADHDVPFQVCGKRSLECCQPDQDCKHMRHTSSNGHDQPFTPSRQNNTTAAACDHAAARSQAAQKPSAVEGPAQTVAETWAGMADGPMHAATGTTTPVTAGSIALSPAAAPDITAAQPLAPMSAGLAAAAAAAGVAPASVLPGHAYGDPAIDAHLNSSFPVLSRKSINFTCEGQQLLLPCSACGKGSCGSVGPWHRLIEVHDPAQAELLGCVMQTLLPCAVGRYYTCNNKPVCGQLKACSRARQRLYVSASSLVMCHKSWQSSKVCVQRRPNKAAIAAEAAEAAAAEAEAAAAAAEAEAAAAEGVAAIAEVAQLRRQLAAERQLVEAERQLRLAAEARVALLELQAAQLGSALQFLAPGHNLLPMSHSTLPMGHNVMPMGNGVSQIGRTVLATGHNMMGCTVLPMGHHMLPVGHSVLPMGQRLVRVAAPRAVGALQ